MFYNIGPCSLYYKEAQIMIVKATLYSKCVTIVALALTRSLNYDRQGMMEMEEQKRL